MDEDYYEDMLVMRETQSIEAEEDAEDDADYGLDEFEDDPDDDEYDDPDDEPYFFPAADLYDDEEDY